MENIGKKWRDKKGNVIEDMPVPATFICEDYPGHYQIKLVEVEHKSRPNGEDERIPGTGLTIVIDGGRLSVTNSSILEHLMNAPCYQDGTVRIDPEDETGFWEAAGAVTKVVRKIVEAPELVRNPDFSQIPKDFKTVKAQKEPAKPEVVS